MNDVTQERLRATLEAVRRHVEAARAELAALYGGAKARYGEACRYTLGREVARAEASLRELAGVDFYGEPCGSLLRLEDELMCEEAEMTEHVLMRQAEYAVGEES